MSPEGSGQVTIVMLVICFLFCCLIAANYLFFKSSFMMYRFYADACLRPTEINTSTD